MAWLLRILFQVTTALGLLLRATARCRAGEGAAAEADVRRALDRLDRIVGKLTARRRQAEVARTATSPDHDATARGVAPAEAAMARATGAVTMLPGRGRAMRGDGSPPMRAWPWPAGSRALPDAPCVPRRGGWREPPWDHARRRALRRGALRLAWTLAVIVTIS